jgi:GNAT superfamily N-acetyltransferase
MAQRMRLAQPAANPANATGATSTTGAANPAGTASRPGKHAARRAQNRSYRALRGCEDRGMRIREATDADWAAIWPFFREIVRAGETYVYPRDLDEPTARALWMVGPPGRTVVAVDEDGTVLGTANMYANKQGGGSHIASGSFMVDPARFGRGTGRALGEYLLDWARTEGFRGVQFNAVVESNTRAVALWQSLGFEIMTTIPEGFLHPTLGYVGLHIMYQKVEPGRGVPAALRT